MNKNTIEFITNYTNREESIGSISFSFDFIMFKRGYNPRHREVEASYEFKINGYNIYKRGVIAVEIPIRDEGAANGNSSWNFDEKAISFEDFYNEAKKEFKVHNPGSACVLNLSDTYSENYIVLNHITDIKFYTRKNIRYMAFETEEESSLLIMKKGGEYADAYTVEEMVKHIKKESHENVVRTKEENRKIENARWCAENFVKENSKFKITNKSSPIDKLFAFKFIYRFPVVVNGGYKEEHKHWPYPSDMEGDHEYLDSDAYYKFFPDKKRKRRPMKLKYRFYNYYAEKEVPKLLKSGKFDERVAYPEYILKKYRKEFEEYYRLREEKEKQKIETEREADLTDEEQKIFNKNMITYSSGIGKIEDNQSFVATPVVNAEIKKLKNKFLYINACESHGLCEKRVENLHMCFLGNPGTGKTTVAREITQMFYDLGYIKYNECVEINAQNMKGGYIGQTATITRALLKHAKNRVLFIDEAYALFDDYEQGYGKEAVAVLLKAMEDNRKDLIVIFAGYTKEMQNFLNMNEGLRSRINRYIDFPNFSLIELCTIFAKQLADKGFVCDEKAMEKFKVSIDEIRKINNFSNARCVRNIVEKIIEEHAYNYIMSPVGNKYIITEKDITKEIIDEIKTMSH